MTIQLTTANGTEPHFSGEADRIHHSEDQGGGRVIVSSEWRRVFPTLGQLETGEPRMLIEHFLPEGIGVVGSLSGIGKTWAALSMVKALRTGKSFLGLFKVPQIVPVVYLVPEMSGRAIRRRAEKLGIPDSEELRFNTLQQGVMKLNNLYLLKMISDLKPVVFLDTAIRFLSGDENNATENSSGLAEAIFALLRAGARSIVALHHSPKASATKDMTLENVLRGTGDIGAMADVVWGIERARRKRGKQWDSEYAKESRDLTRLRLELVKGREDDDMAGDLLIQGRPFIDEGGDFRVLQHDGVALDKADDSADRIGKMVHAIESNMRVSQRQLSRVTGWNTSVVKEKALAAGYRWTENGWERYKATIPTNVDLRSLAEDG
jgi:AAA domain